MNFSPFPCRSILAAAFFSLLLLPAVHAQSTLVSILSFDLSGGNLPTNVSFAAFDPTLGTLQSVTLDYSGSQRYDFSFWNNHVGSTNPITYGYQPNYTDLSDPLNPFGGSSLTLNGASQAIPDSTKLTGTKTLTGLAATPINAAETAARTTFFAGNDPTAQVVSSGGYSVYGTLPVAGSLTLSNAFDGSLSAQFEPFTLASLTTGNTASSQMQDLTGTFTLTYTYAAIPEPASCAAVLGAAMLGFALKRRRVSSPRLIS